MKKQFTLSLVFLFCILLCACGTQSTANDIGQFPFIGTWKNDDGTVYMRIHDGGEIVAESMLTNTATTTVNGVTTTSTSTSTITNTYTWSLSDNTFLYNGKAPYTPSEENGEYRLIGEKTTYLRVGDLDYVIPFETEDTETKDPNTDAEEYVLGNTISVPGIELVFTEKGITDDIRISSKSSGIKITSGPSVEEGKQYVYLKGTLKNTATTSAMAVIAGNIYLDDYEFSLKTDTISTSGSFSRTIDPLETVNILLYAQVSDEMAGMFTNGRVIFGFNDNFADCQLDQAQHLYFVEITR